MTEIPKMEKPSRSESLAEKETGRIESFSDGVFSIAMTLLVLESKVPALAKTPTASALLTELGRQWPSYFAFVTSFAAVLIMWVNHHGIFRLVHRTNSNLLFTNGFLLLLVTAVPFPTALVATYLRTPGAGVACAVYAGTFVVISTTYGLLLIAAQRGKHLLAPGASAEVTRRIRDCFKVGLPWYIIATAAAPFSPWLSLGICSALWIYWVFVSIERTSAFRQ